MALFKLISNGNVTYLELDGKTINGACVQNISFNHDVRNGDKNVSLHLDIDLQEAYNSSQKGICGILENDGMFELVNRNMSEREKELRAKHSSIATVTYEGLDEIRLDGESTSQ